MLHYTLSNDNENLYLAVKSTDPVNVNKIMGGGVSLIVNTDGSKKSKTGSVVTYPILSKTDIKNALGTPTKQKLTPEQRDSAIDQIRLKLLKSMKEIKILGLNGVTDSVVMIYNDYGIKANSSFDTDGSYIYELAIPLQLLNLTMDKPKELAYSLRVNGVPPISQGPDRKGGDGSPAYQAITSPTFFWGKYVLAKK